MTFPSSLSRQLWLTFFLVVLLIGFARAALWAQTSALPPAVDVRVDQAHRLFVPVALAASAQEDHQARGKLPPVLTNPPVPTPVVTPAPTSPPPSAPPLTTLAPITPTLPLTTGVSLTWEFQFAVANSKLTTQWVMKAVADDGTTAIVQRLDLSESCSLNGDVDLVGTQANFTGGYIACDLPDFATEVQNYIAASECDCDFNLLTPPWVAARFAIAGLTSDRTQPLVALENGFRYEIDTSNPGNGYTRWVFDSQHSLTGPTFPLAGGQRSFTGYNPAWVLPTLALDAHNAFLHNVSFAQAAMNTPANAFLSWLPTQAQITAPVLDYSINPSPTTIYIGGQPGSSARFMGTIDKLTLDPGCRGFGSGGGNP